MIVVVTENEIVPDWYTKYKMASEVSIRDSRIFRALEDGPSFLKDDVEQILLPRDHLDVPMPIQGMLFLSRNRQNPLTARSTLLL